MEYNSNGPVNEGYEQQSTQPYPYGPNSNEGKKKSKTWLWILIAAVIVCASAVVVMDVLGVFGTKKMPGNAGVWALVDFSDQQAQMQEEMIGPAQKEIGDRLMQEPFEVDSQLSFSSDAFQQAGIPFNKISLDAKAKYDLKDVGIKLTMLGMVDVGAYLIEDDFVMDVMGEAASVPIDLPIKEDLGDSMSLKDRIKAFLPFLPEDDKLLRDVLTQLALSVPDEYTKEETVDVYSPMEDDEIEVKAITTKMDKDELRDVIDTFVEGLDENDKLKDDLQDFIDEITRFFSLEDVDIDDGLAEINTKEFDEMEDFELSWSVYRLNGKYIGVEVKVELKETSNQLVYMAERDGNDLYMSSKISGDDVGNQDTQQKITWNGDKMLFDSKHTMSSTDINGEEQIVDVKVSGTVETEKDSDNEYHVEMFFEVETDSDQLGQLNTKMPEVVKLEFSIDADCLFGDDLGTLEDSKDWEDIYDKEWGDIDNLFKGFANMSDIGSAM